MVQKFKLFKKLFMSKSCSYVHNDEIFVVRSEGVKTRNTHTHTRSLALTNLRERDLVQTTLTTLYHIWYKPHQTLTLTRYKPHFGFTTLYTVLYIGDTHKVHAHTSQGRRNSSRPTLAPSKIVRFNGDLNDAAPKSARGG